MIATIDNILEDALGQPPNRIGYFLSSRLQALYSGDWVLEGSGPFNVQGYAEAGHCEASERSSPPLHRHLHWTGQDGNQIRGLQHAYLDVTWEGRRLHALITHFTSGAHPPQPHHFLVAPTRQIAEEFHAAVCDWSTPHPREHILVFDVNGWRADEALLEAIRNTTLDGLVLRGTLRDDILADLRSFFESEETYRKYAVPWKRGVLFVGPAGNGKTHAVKGVINALRKPCLYVKTFSGHGPEESAIGAIFYRAREIAPCVLVFEDLDSIISQHNRSYFLNELDGFAGNDGILTLATTNHPERLDPAIINRPSRFDRKYPFDLPRLEERREYTSRWNDSLQPELQLSSTGVDAVAEASDEFSFAYLKELFISAMMRWVTQPARGDMDRVMEEQVAVLREQMTSVQELPSDPGYEQMLAGRHAHFHDGPTARHGPSPIRHSGDVSF